MEHTAEESQEYNVLKSEEVVKSQEEVVKSQEELVKSQEEVVGSQEELVKSQEEVVVSQEEVVKSLEEVVKSQEEVVGSQEELVKNQEELVESQEEVVKSQEEVVKSQEEVVKNQEDVVESQEEVVKSQEEVVESQEEVVKNQEDVVESQEELVKSQEEVVVSQEEVLRREEEALNREEEALNMEEEALNREEDVLNREEEDLKNEEEVLNREEELKSSDSDDGSYVMLEKEDLESSVVEVEAGDHQQGEKEDVADPEDGWTFVLGHDKLKKKVLIKGSGERPVNGQVVTVRCCGRLCDDKEVDKQDALCFTLGDGDVIQAFDLCVALADEKETFELFTEAQYAFGAVGQIPDIPPNASITYKVEVLSVAPAVDFASLAIAERVELAGRKRERGNELYIRGDHPAAISAYTKALKIVDDSAENHKEDATELQKLIDMRVKCFNNMTAAQLKIEAYDAAIKSADEVLRIQPENVKALFRKGKCLAAKTEISSAINCLKRAVKLEPESKIIHAELSRLTEKFRAEEQSQKAMYQRMLGTDKKPFNPPKTEESSHKWIYAGIAGVVAVASAALAYKAAT